MSLFVPSPFISGFTPLAGATAWNPSDKTSAQLVLSNGNLTATNTVSATARGVRAVQGRSSGKYYFEVIINLSVGSFAIGARTSSDSLTSIAPSVAGGFSVRTGGTYANSSGAYSSPIGSFTTADILGFALDFSAGFVYLRKNGTWGTGMDPDAGSGGYGISSTLYPHAQFAGNGDQVTANFGASPFVYPAPIGYTKGFS